MEQKFERIERHLYRRKYGTASGELRTLYYGVFRCRLRRKPRYFPLGSNLKVARDELKELEARNVRREDFDLDKIRPDPEPEPQRLTLSGFIPRFLETKKAMRSYAFYKACSSHLARILGAVHLDEITKTRIMEYKQIRQFEPIMRHGKAVAGSKVCESTRNREVATLVNLLNIAADEGVLDKIPATRKLREPEDHLARERVLEGDEYRLLLEASPRWLQRIMIGAYEGCLSRVDLLTLTWDEVHRKRREAAVIKLVGGRNKTKTKQKVPVSPELWGALDELEEERRKVTSIHGHNLVFIKDGKPISTHSLRKAFDRAKAKAGISDFHFHDFRHCAITRWSLAGISEDLRKLAAGHSRRSVHQGYVNPPDEQMVEVFVRCLCWKFRRVFDGKVAADGRTC